MNNVYSPKNNQIHISFHRQDLDYNHTNFDKDLSINNLP